MLQPAWLDPTAIIGNDDFHPTRIFLPQPARNDHLTAVRHAFQGIQDQVEKNLLELGRPDFYRWQARLPFLFEHDPAALNPLGR
jgi:hypothetical protein